MKFKWIKVNQRLPKTKRGFRILSDNILVKMPGGDYIEAYHNKSNNTWYNAENNKKLKNSPLEWCEVI